MKKRKAKTDNELASIIEEAISKAESFADAKLTKERQEVLEYYRGDLPKPMHSGDSKYVSRDVFDAVDTMRGSILDTFLATERNINFRPEKGEGPEGARQASDFCRYVFYRGNEGEDILYDVATDGLMARYSVAKVYIEEEKTTEDYEIEGLDEDEFIAFLEQFDTYEFNELEVEGNLYVGSVQGEKLNRKVKVEVIPPEDFLIAARSSDIKTARLVAQRYKATLQKLVNQGFSKEKVMKASQGGSSMGKLGKELETELRFDDVGSILDDDAYDSADEMAKKIEVFEVYMEADCGQGLRLYRFTYSGGQVLEKEPVSRVPFAVFVPIPISHAFHGENFAKATIPIQNARTVLFRQIINHSLTTNNPRSMVLSGTLANPTELLDNRLSGIVNVRRMDGIAPIPQAPLNPFVFNLIQLLDEDKEEVTGISKLSQGLNKDAISTQNSEGMVDQLISVSQTRQRVIARRFGLFMRNLWVLIYNTALEGLEVAEFEDITGQFVQVKTDDWIERKAASIELALGRGDMAKEAAKYFQIDQYLAADPRLAPHYTQTERFQVISRALAKQGIEDIASIFKPPEMVEPPPPNPAEELQMKQLAAQTELTQAQAYATKMKADNDKMKLELEMMKFKASRGDRNFDEELETAEFVHERAMDVREMENAEKTVDQKANFAPDG